MRSRDDVSSHRMTETALLLACACVLSYAESVLLPASPIPGLRIGLANIAVVVALDRIGASAAAMVAIGRVFVVCAAMGTLMGPVGAMALAGALCSWAAMAGLRACGSRFSVVGWSVAGASVHVIAQLVTASVIVGSGAVIALSPVSLALSLPTGLMVGFAARLLISRISRPVLSVA